MDKSLLSGSNTMLLLQLLKDQDMYGYQMIEELRKRSQDVFEMKVARYIRCCILWKRADFCNPMRGKQPGRKGSIIRSPRMAGRNWSAKKGSGRSMREL